MFSQILGKSFDNFDISIFQNHTPDSIMNYYHHATLEISMPAYWQLKELYEDAENANDNIRLWLCFFEEVLGARADLTNAQEHPEQSTIGPYYYPFTNTTIYFSSYPPANNPVTSADICFLNSLADPPTPSDKVAKYYQSLKK